MDNKNVMKAVSIRDEIRNIVKQELKVALGQTSPKVVPSSNVQPAKQERYSSIKVSSLNNLQAVVQTKLNELKTKNPSLKDKPINIMLEIAPANNSAPQAKPIQNNSQQKPINNQQKPQAPVLQINSLEGLKDALQKALMEAMKRKQEFPQKTESQNKQVPNVQVKIIPKQQPVQVQKNPQNMPQKTQQNSNEPGGKFLGGDKRGVSKNNPVLQQQATDLLTKIANAKKQQQNNQKK